MSKVTASAASTILRWLKKRGVDMARIRAYDAEDAGAGLAAATAAKSGQVLMSIPHSIWAPLSALDARASLPSEMSAHIDEHAAAMGGGAALADATLLAARIAQPDFAP